MNKIVQKNNFRVLEKLVDSNKVIFVFTALGTKIPLYRLFIRQLNKFGYGVVIYDYPARLVLNAELGKYDKLYESIKADIDERLARIKPANAYAYSVSMGTIMAQRITSNTPAISHVVLVLPYGDLTANIMDSPVTRKTRKTMSKNDISVEVLREAVKHYDPIKNVEGLKNKKVWVHQSLRDRILDYKITVKTKETFGTLIKDFKYTQSKRLGHAATGIAHMANVKELDKFFRS